MLEILWLLLPIAAISGWFAARHSLLVQQEKNQQQHLPADYFKGLNYLLNEQPEKAVDIFSKFIDINEKEIDSDAIEMHLTLGGLFRRQGEVNRATQIHKNLLTHSALSPQQRDLALWELAQDYRRAGLLDRAEDLFGQLTQSREHNVHAYHQLLDIYQQEHDWEKAIQMAKELANISDEPLNHVIAQYYCELTALNKQAGADYEAIQLALSIDSNCVRASLLQSQLALTQGNHQQAINALKKVEYQDTSYLPEIIEPLKTCYMSLAQEDELITYLQHLFDKYGGISPMLALAECLSGKYGIQAATTFLTQELHKNPSIRGINYLIELSLTEENAFQTHLFLLKAVFNQLLKNKPIYQCKQCGFTGKSLHWQCPSCKQWNSIKPIQGIDGE